MGHWSLSRDVNELEFETTGNTEKSLSWKELFKNALKEESGEKKEATQTLPTFEKDERVLRCHQAKRRCYNTTEALYRRSIDWHDENLRKIKIWKC